ncbi:hypothetical protein ACIBL3_37550 [Kribbella sp. NPDC050124]|uniref:hypothetical protein n=1 Tax=Kribbella sp. NPDC050124 TaxID=3364114 RepID=UPI00378A42A0
MRIGVLKKAKNHKYRVAITPIGLHASSCDGRRPGTDNGARRTGACLRRDLSLPHTEAHKVETDRPLKQRQVEKLNRAENRRALNVAQHAGLG